MISQYTVDLVIVNPPTYVGETIIQVFQHEFIVSEGDSSRILGMQSSLMFIFLIEYCNIVHRITESIQMRNNA